jgi:hypothetical protein
MKAKFGAIVVDGRGKAGGHVFSKNKSGAYMRTKVTPTNPSSTASSTARQMFGAISQGWSGLSASQRDGWNNAVNDWKTTNIFGDLNQPSGKALFQRLNNQAQAVGYSAVTTAPAKAEMVQGIVTAVVIDISSTTITLTGEYTGSGARIQIFATPSMSQGTTFVKNRLNAIYSPVANAFVDVDAWTAYVAKYGTPTAGANVYVGVCYVLSNGQASPMQIVKATVQA